MEPLTGPPGSTSTDAMEAEVAIVGSGIGAFERMSVGYTATDVSCEGAVACPGINSDPMIITPSVDV